MAVKLSDKTVREAAAPAKGQRLLFDTEISGFAVRVTKSGAKSFVIDYRLDGRQWRYTLGRYGTWSVQAARDEAKDIRRQIDRGENPAKERSDHRAAPTVTDLARRYWEDHGKNLRDAKRNAEMLGGEFHPKDRKRGDVLPAIGHMKVEDVRHSDIYELHRKITKRGSPIRANRVVALLSKMFSRAVRPYEWITDNPVKGIEKNQEHKRERFLSQKEIVAVSEALAAYPGQGAANAVRFIMLTGARRSEVMQMKWSEVDWDSGVWTKPATNTKQKTDHRIPLSAPALQMLTGLYNQAGDGEPFVFPGRNAGEPIKQLNSVWAFVRERTGLHDVRIHDLRHTFASILVSRGVSLPMIGALLGHTQPQTTQRYAHLFHDPLRDAADQAGAVLTGQGSSSQDGAAQRGTDENGNVTPMKRGANG